MKITKVSIYDVALGEDCYVPLNPIIVRIDTDRGVYGAGEVGLAYISGAKAAAAMVKDLAASFLIGADPRRIEQIWETLYRHNFCHSDGKTI